MEETPNPTSQEAGKSVLGAEMWMEVLVKVIAPRIAVCVAENQDIENRQQLHKAFCHQHSVRMSYSTFSGWCEDLGISFKKRIEVNIPGWKAMPQTPARTTRADFRASPVEEPVDPNAPVEWDPAVPPMQIPVDAFNDNTPIILPGGLRAPVFLENRDFAN